MIKSLRKRIDQETRNGRVTEAAGVDFYLFVTFDFVPLLVVYLMDRSFFIPRQHFTTSMIVSIPERPIPPPAMPGERLCLTHAGAPYTYDTSCAPFLGSGQKGRCSIYINQGSGRFLM